MSVSSRVTAVQVFRGIREYRLEVRWGGTVDLNCTANFAFQLVKYQAKTPNADTVSVVGVFLGQCFGVGADFFIHPRNMFGQPFNDHLVGIDDH